jgi:predicted Zn-dependent protease
MGLAGGCTSDQQVIAQANQMHTELEPSVVTDPVLDGYVQEVGDRIVTAAREMHAQGQLEGAEAWMFEDVQFHLVASPTLNAFTTGGKHVYLYTQLFEESQTEDAFAAVVGHEFGHIVGRHVQDSMNNQLLAGLAGLGLVGATAAISDEESRSQNTAIAGAAAGVGTTLGITYFGREKEREADDLGFEFYVRAGYDPQQFPRFFENMISQGYDQGAGGLAGYLSTHPQLRQRVQAAEQAAENVPPETIARYERPAVAEGQELDELKERSSELTQRAAQAAQAGQATSLTRALAILDAFPRCVAPDEQPQ